MLLLLQSGPGRAGSGASAPVNTVLPAISGTTQVGSALTTTNGTWTGSPTGYTYQWLRGGVNIGGATSISYLLVTADLGATITVTVTATNAGGSANATSAGVGPITSAIVKSIDGTAGSQFSGAGPGTITLSTTQTNDVVVLVYYHEAGSGSQAISTVTSPRLTWARRSNWVPAGLSWDYEIWWAPAAAVLTSEVITITLTAAIDDAAYHVFAVNGCSNISSPWDTNTSLTTAHNVTNATNLTLSGISTNSTSPMLFGFTGNAGGAHISTPAGTTKIRADQNNGGGALYAFLTSFYQVNSSALSSASYTASQDASVSWGMVIDALA